MTREIKFKAKRLDNGEWVYGMLSKIPLYGETFHYVIVDVICLEKKGEFDGLKLLNYKIDENTICEFTGLKDDNKNEVWERDILQFGAQNGSKSEVKFIKSNAGFLVKDKFGAWQWLYDVLASTNAKVIGNTQDNPELLSTTTNDSN